MKTAGTKRRAFTLVELMIVVGIIAMLCTIAIPNFVRARSQSQTQACINNLRQIDDASQEWALDTFQAPTASVTFGAIQSYLKNAVVCPAGGQGATFGSSYTLSTVSNKPACNYLPATHKLAPDDGAAPHLQPGP